MKTMKSREDIVLWSVENKIQQEHIKIILKMLVQLRPQFRLVIRNL